MESNTGAPLRDEKIPTQRASVALKESFSLGEGALWEAHTQTLHWVDILGKKRYTGKLKEESLNVIETHSYASMVCAVAVASDKSYAIATQENLIFERDGRILHEIRVIPSDSRRRINDCRVDPSGRLLIGTLSLDGVRKDEKDQIVGYEELLRLEDDLSLTVIDADLTLSNGLGWSRDGKTMYSVDTFTHTIFKRSYDADSGATGERKIFLVIDEGYPDGICIDSRDHMWVALWGAGKVCRYSPEGNLVEVVEVDAPHASCPVLAGPNLDRLIVTTAAGELSADELGRYPLSGSIFSASVKVPGCEQPLWKVPSDLK